MRKQRESRTGSRLRVGIGTKASSDGTAEGHLWIERLDVSLCTKGGAVVATRDKPWPWTSVRSGAGPPRSSTSPEQSLSSVSPVPWNDGSPPWLTSSGDRARPRRAHRQAAAAHAVPAEARVPPPALHDPATREALRRYRKHSRKLLLLALAMFSVAAASLAAFSFIADDVVGGLAVGVAVVCFVAGIVGLARGRRMGSLLSKHAWELVPARVGHGVSGRPVVLLPPTASTGATGAPSEAFIVWASIQRFADLVGHDDVLVAGRSPGRAFVVSPPGEPQLMIARRALLPFMAKAQASTFTEGMPPTGMACS
jgi:hypothetical protein